MKRAIACVSVLCEPVTPNPKTPAISELLEAGVSVLLLFKQPGVIVSSNMMEQSRSAQEAWYAANPTHLAEHSMNAVAQPKFAKPARRAVDSLLDRKPSGPQADAKHSHSISFNGGDAKVPAAHVRSDTLGNKPRRPVHPPPAHILREQKQRQARLAQEAKLAAPAAQPDSIPAASDARSEHKRISSDSTGSDKQCDDAQAPTPTPLWRSYWDDSAEAVYYYCTLTQEARWEKPDADVDDEIIY
jgi:hypothetical protein